MEVPEEVPLVESNEISEQQNKRARALQKEFDSTRGIFFDWLYGFFKHKDNETGIALDSDFDPSFEGHHPFVINIQLIYPELTAYVDYLSIEFDPDNSDPKPFVVIFQHNIVQRFMSKLEIVASIFENRVEVFKFIDARLQRVALYQLFFKFIMKNIFDSSFTVVNTYLRNEESFASYSYSLFTKFLTKEGWNPSLTTNFLSEIKSREDFDGVLPFYSIRSYYKRFIVQVCSKNYLDFLELKIVNSNNTRIISYVTASGRIKSYVDMAPNTQEVDIINNFSRLPPITVVRGLFDEIDNEIDSTGTTKYVNGIIREARNKYAIRWGKAYENYNVPRRTSISPEQYWLLAAKRPEEEDIGSSKYEDVRPNKNNRYFFEQ